MKLMTYIHCVCGTTERLFFISADTDNHLEKWTLDISFYLTKYWNMIYVVLVYHHNVLEFLTSKKIRAFAPTLIESRVLSTTTGA